MKEEHNKIKSECDGLELDYQIFIPDENPKGIVQLSHGMVERKEYYFDFMKFLTENVYVTIINDHRGHGNSVLSKEDLGYFYEESADYIVEDLHQITKLVKQRFPGLKVHLIGHSMGSLVVRKYLKKHDNEIASLIVCGSPSINKLSKVAKIIAKTIKKTKGERYRSKTLSTLALGKDRTNKWLSRDNKYVDEYNLDEKCGFVFTANGFINLAQLMIDTYTKSGWELKNPNLKILFIAGEEDRIIGNLKKWHESIDFMRGVGYKNIEYKSYENMKHAILKEIGKENVYNDILNFINKI